MSNYPASLDNDTNLFLVHDALRVKLALDYNPGDTSITIDDPHSVISNFPPTGIITLTEQCSDIDKRALTFFYSAHTTTTFTGLQLIDCFADMPKPKRLTDVTMNVMAMHHNALKDAIIAIERFAGIKGEISLVPLKGTMEARINFLRKLVLQPRAWFAASRNVGVVPLCLTIKDFSTRQPNTWTWDFGDGDISFISRTQPIMTGDVSKCYYTPGEYNITLTVQNDFGINVITLQDYITARVSAPDLATISFTPGADQTLTDGILRSRINNLISLMVNTSGQQPLDPIVSYTWDFNDDLAHDHSQEAIASYSIGGRYDVVLHANTQLGAFRITEFPDAIDIVEDSNLWHFIFDPTAPAAATTKNLFAYEFGLLSQVYKTANVASATPVTRNASFLTGQAEQAQQTREFLRNNGFTSKTLTASGDHGNALLFWAEGGVNYGDSQYIRFREYNGFDNVWVAPSGINSGDKISRRWNWLSFSATSNVYFVLGNTTTSLTNQTLTSLQLSNYTINDSTLSSYQNGADELQVNVGGGSDGNFSVYRGAWQNSAGYFVRNDGTGSFFRLKSFYATEGIFGTPIQMIRKLTDMPGSTKFEGQMVALSNGIYFFNNTGEVVVYNPTTNVWQSGGPGVNSPSFSALQDSSVPGFDNPANTLVATGDGDHNAYLSYDYSVSAFLKFNEVDLTFSALPTRPSGEQFLLGIY